MSIPVIEQDKANHATYGNLASFFGAVFGLVAGALIFRHIVIMLVMGGVSAFVCAAVVGKLKEMRDQKANDAADAAGLPRPHSVEAADMNATWGGSLPVAFSLLVAALLSNFLVT